MTAKPRAPFRVKSGLNDDKRSLPQSDAPTSLQDPFRRAVDAIDDYAIFLLDSTGHIATWNRGAQRIKGYAPRDIIGRHFSIFYPDEANARGWPDQELREASRVGRFEDEGWRLRNDGTRFWANVIITALRDDDGRLVGFSKITRDLTERRAHEERLRQSEEGFRLLLEGIEDYAIFMLDPDGRVTSWNAGAEKIMGYTASEILGQHFERFFQESDRKSGRPAEELRDALLHRRFSETAWRVRRDGTRFWADVVVTALYDAEERHRGYAKVTRDLSERKRMEALEEHGRHLTEFLAMLSHELRNPLAPIRSAAGVIALKPDDPQKVAWARGVIERQTAHLSRLVDDLLDVSRITRGKLRLRAEPMDANEAVRRAAESARPNLEARRQRFDMALDPSPLPVHGDLTRITQVVTNILNNAAKYTPEGGAIRLTTGREEGEVVIVVRDTGVGMTAALLERVFDLFAQGDRTLERAEGGLGIGLTLARRIVELHGGGIVAASEGPGRGSTFTVRLPLYAERRV